MELHNTQLNNNPDIDINSFDLKKYTDFCKAVVFYPRNDHGYVLVSKFGGLLTKQAELLLSYINDNNPRTRSNKDIDPNLFLNVAFNKIITNTGKNALHLAIERQDHEIANKLIENATPEQLFLQDDKGNTALHSLVKYNGLKTAIAVVKKEGVTAEQLLLKDKEGKTPSDYVIKQIEKVGNTCDYLSSGNQHPVADMKNLLKEIGIIAGVEELKSDSSNQIVSDVIKEINVELQFKSKPEFEKVKGGMFGAESTNEKITKAARPEYPKLIKGWREHMESQNAKKKLSNAQGL
jgi:hypothetical protein